MNIQTLLSFFLFLAFSSPMTASAQHLQLRYLALGDSYTIGEGVEERDRFPNQVVQAWNASSSLGFFPPTLIAKTGWTVDELEAGIEANPPSSEGYDLVTLLIGVNNQYRGRTSTAFALDFEKMLQRAIAYANGKKDRVMVLSIPDWGVTPFARSKGLDPAKIASEIDAYNGVKKEICDRYGIVFIDITSGYRQGGANPESLADDQLHPSGSQYTQWANKVIQVMKTIDFN